MYTLCKLSFCLETHLEGGYVAKVSFYTRDRGFEETSLMNGEPLLYARSFKATLQLSFQLESLIFVLTTYNS
jgi:hypothetical protein